MEYENQKIKKAIESAKEAMKKAQEEYPDNVDNFYDEPMKKDSWEDKELYQEIRKILADDYENATIDEKLDLLIKNIPNIIESFEDCNSDEEYRMLAKKSDGTLATIQMKDLRSGFQVYAPITLNAYEYKKFYFETLFYSIITYTMFFRNEKFQITSNDIERSGILSIEEETLPHLLGLEPKLVSSKDSALMESIIPGYNDLNVFNKILSIIENNEKIIKYEEENNIDIFNYYKNMQKNKDFLLLGRFFSVDEENTKDKNKIVLFNNTNNQLCLYKKSNMNNVMNRNLCKMIIQKMDNGNYFPRSLQSVSQEMIESLNIQEKLSKEHNITMNGKELTVMTNKPNSDGLILTVIDNFKNSWSKVYVGIYYDEPKEKYKLARKLISILNGDPDIINAYDDSYKVIINNDSLKSKMIDLIKQTSKEKIEMIENALDRKDYKLINDFINQNDIIEILNDQKEVSSQIDCLSTILVLIKMYIQESDQIKQMILESEIDKNYIEYKVNKNSIDINHNYYDEYDDDNLWR